MLICIDAGHGKYTSGKRCMKSIDPAETREWYLNQRIATKLCNLLSAYDVETMRMDDVTGETDIPLSERCAKANASGAKFFLSIHHNAGINGGAGGGIVVFSGIGKQPNSEAMAEIAYKHLIDKTGLRGNRSNPIAKANFHVLRETKMAAILIEHGFMDSTHDTPIILTDDFATKCAEALCDAFVERFSLKKRGSSRIIDKAIPADRFCLEMVDDGKRDCGGAYCNAGYFGGYSEKGEPFTLPVGHTKADYKADSKWNEKYMKERGKLADGSVTFDSGSWKYANALCGKAVSTLIVKDGKATIDEYVHLPSCDYAISGIPFIRYGNQVTTGTAMAQGWDSSPMRATKHIFIGLKDESTVHVLSVETHTGNCLSSGEAYDMLKGYRDVIKLDGGGSYYWNFDGHKDSTGGNRRICTIIREKAPAEPVKPPEKPGEWYEPYMARVKDLGIMDGTRPTDPVTRAELAAVVCKLIDKA